MSSAGTEYGTLIAHRFLILLTKARHSRGGRPYNSLPISQ